MAMGMKMGNNEHVKEMTPNNKWKEKEIGFVNIDEKTAENEANEIEKNPHLKEQIQHLKFVFKNFDKLRDWQQKELKDIMDNMKDLLQANSEFLSEKWLKNVADTKKFPDILDTEARKDLADKIAENFDTNSFKILKNLMKHPEIFEDEGGLKEERDRTLQELQTTVENIWKYPQFQDKQQIDKVKTVTKDTKWKLQELQTTVENIWNQLQDKQKQIDKVKAVTKVTKGK